MANFLLLEPTTQCQDVCTYARSQCLPILRNCQATCTDWLLADFNFENWNCNRCQSEKEYYHPVSNNDTLMFQTRMFDAYNPDRENPVDGWGTAIKIQIYDGDGVLLTDDHTTISSEYLFGYAESIGGSYQLINVDISLINSDCFTVVFSSYNDLDVLQEQYVSVDFRKIDEFCKDTVLIKGDYCFTDCCEHYYGLPDASVSTGGHTDFIYDNTARYYAKLTESEASVTRTSFNRITTKSETLSNYALHTKLMPPNIASMMIKQHFGAEKFYIDGVQYYADTIQPDNKGRGRLQSYVIDSLFLDCDKNFRCC